MESFAGRLAVVTGGGSGMGRELVVQLAAEGCSVATCDVNAGALAETAQLAPRPARRAAPASRPTSATSPTRPRSTRSATRCVAQHDTDHVNLLFNNAGIGGGGSFVTAEREEWERTFGVCWGGVYNCARAFVPLLVASDDGYLVNTSSVNGFWASLGPGIPHTAYSTAKFAVKGFSEALIEDFRVNAPAREGRGRDAGPHRHRHRHQHPHGPRHRPRRDDRRGAGRGPRTSWRSGASRPTASPTTTCSRW